jgi:PPM family protein phosphatase
VRVEKRVTTFLDRDMSAPEAFEAGRGKAVVFTARCPGHTTANEDAAAVIHLEREKETAAVLAVADGLGGSASGSAASAAAVKALGESVRRVWLEGGLLRTAILDGFEKANETIRALGVGAATTLTVVEIQDGAMRPYHVGDSAVLLFGGRGKVKHQSIAHSPIGYGVEAGLIHEDDAMHHEDRHIVSNVLGAEDMHIEIGPRRKLAARDTIVVMSDGLADNLHANEIIQIARNGPIEKAAQTLATEASERMNDPKKDAPSKPDDLTFIVYRLKA